MIKLLYLLCWIFVFNIVLFLLLQDGWLSARKLDSSTKWILFLQNKICSYWIHALTSRWEKEWRRLVPTFNYSFHMIWRIVLHNWEAVSPVWPSLHSLNLNTMDCSLPGSSVNGIFQARILEWVATPSSRGSSRPRDRTCFPSVSCTDRQVLKCTKQKTKTNWVDENARVRTSTCRISLLKPPVAMPPSLWDCAFPARDCTQPPAVEAARPNPQTT